MQLKFVFCAALVWAGAAAAQTEEPGQAVFVRSSPIHPAPPSDEANAPATAQASVPGPQSAPAQASAPGPQVAIARRIVDAAGAFDGYMRRTAAIDPKFADGAAVARAVEVASVYEPRQLEEGAIAYAALLALQDPMFVQVVRDVSEDPRARDTFAAALIDHPEAVLGAAAARKAATRVSTVLGAMGVKLVSSGVAVKQGAYDLEGQAWSKQPIASPDERLARIKAESEAVVSLSPTDTATLINGLAASHLRNGEAVVEAQTVTPVVTQGLALAALAILGKAGDGQEQRINSLLTEAKNAHCLQLAKMDALECLAVAGPHYENAFCLGTHDMIEPGKCIASAAGVSDDQLSPMIDRRSVLVPVAMTVPEASERDSIGAAPAGGGVMVPMAAPAPPVQYSPYVGPMMR
jgi:hypothetical protein